MLPFIDAQSEAIGEICRRFHVERLEVFGSATGAGFDPGRSDLDFLVAFQAGSTSLENYLGLAEALEEVFGNSVDLVIERTIRNPYFRQTVDATRRLVYGHKEQEAAV